MTALTLAVVLEYLRTDCAAQELEPLTDGQLLERFLTARDEAAFATLVYRHGGMVLGVCRRVLSDGHFVEDAFQATFLVLVRRAAAIRRDAPLGPWLYGVAQRVALKARARTAARQSRQRELTDMPNTEPLDERTWQELRPVLDEEVGRLPEKCRAPIVLCYFEGKSYDQAAQELGWPKSSLASRLAKGRELLRQRLVQRGITLSMGALTTALAEKAAGVAVAALLTINTAKAATSVAAGKTVAGGVLLAQALALAEEAMKTMIGIKGKLAALLLALSLAVGAGLAGYAAWVEQPPPRPEEGRASVAQKQPGKKDAAGGVARDRFGDPLPKGAVARLGTIRFRHGDNATALAYSPDGKWLASTSPSLSVSRNGSLHLLEADTGRVVVSFSLYMGLASDSGALAFSPDSKTFVTGGAAIIDVATGKPRRPLPSRDKALLANFIDGCSPDGKLVARQQLTKETGVILIDAATGEELRPIKWGDKPIPPTVFGMQGGPDGSIRNQFDLARPTFSPDGKILATASPNDKVIRLWNVDTGKELHKLQGHEQTPRHLAFSPDGKMLASTGADERLIRLWNPQTGKALREIKLDVPLIGVHFAPGGKLLATDPESSTVRLFDPGSGKELRRWQMPCACVAFSPDGKILASAGKDDHVLHRWDVSTGRSLDDPERAHTFAVAALRFAPDGQTLFSLDAGPTALAWDLKTLRDRNATFGGPVGSVKKPLIGGITATHELKLSPTGKVAAVVRGRGARSVYLCDVETGKDLHVLPNESRPGHTNYAEFSPDGKILSLRCADGLKLWDVATGKPLPLPLLPVAFVHAWSGDGKLIATLDFENSPSAKGASIVHLCEVATGKEIRRFQSKPTVTVSGLALSSDGKALALYTSSELVVFDTATGKRTEFPKADFAGADKPMYRVDKVVFSPSGERLAAAIHETIQLFDVRTGQLIREFHAGSRIASLRFSPDGRVLASAGADTTILLWDVAPSSAARSSRKSNR